MLRKSCRYRLILMNITWVLLSQICFSSFGNTALSSEKLKVHKLDKASPISPTKAKTLKVLSLNIGHGRGKGWHQTLQRKKTIKRNLDTLANLLKGSRADLIALQEVDRSAFWTGRIDQADYLAKKSEYPYFIHGEHFKKLKINFGTAILSKYLLLEPVSYRFSPSPPTMNKGWVLATIRLQGHSYEKIDLVSVHLDFSRKSVQEKQIKEMVQVLTKRKNPLIVMGDFNSEWKDKKSSVKKLTKMLNLKAYQVEQHSMTFPKLNKQFDWILISKELNFAKCETLTEQVSDHLALLCEILI